MKNHGRDFIYIPKENLPAFVYTIHRRLRYDTVAWQPVTPKSVSVVPDGLFVSLAYVLCGEMCDYTPCIYFFVQEVTR